MKKSDEQLMAEVKKGRLDRVNDLFQRYSARIFSYFLKSTLCRDDSNDLTQNVFIRVINYRNSYREGNSFEIWIFQIARNQLKDHFRKLKVHRERVEVMTSFPDQSEDNRDYQDEEQQLYKSLEKLPVEKRELLVMSKFQGMKYEQIAAIRQTSISAIKTMVHRTIKELRTIYFNESD